jgi:tellurite methyltransferase|tara:strand:- start:1536 stop:2168 length:633 start_codon:yes stop_codon:yes gene_type:complete
MKDLKHEISYWNKFYNNYTPPKKETSFAFYCKKYLKNFKGVIYDVGCGNGRDTAYFNKNKLNCYGLDLSKDAISKNKKKYNSLKHLYLNKNFTKFNFNSSAKEFVVYSRFTLHSINSKEEGMLFKNIIKSKNFKLFMIETRTIYDELYGVGKKVGDNEYVSTHYRRFIDPVEIKKKLQKIFNIKLFKLGRNYAKYKNENPKVLRIILSKK